jgi:hypothetical protein
MFLLHFLNTIRFIMHIKSPSPLLLEIKMIPISHPGLLCDCNKEVTEGRN